MGDAAQLEEHKTIIYDYLCPFPEEYEKTYTPSEELTVPMYSEGSEFLCVESGVLKNITGRHR